MISNPPRSVRFKTDIGNQIKKATEKTGYDASKIIDVALAKFFSAHSSASEIIEAVKERRKDLVECGSL